MMFIRIHPPEGHRSMPHSPLPSIKSGEISKTLETPESESGRLQVGLRMEKCCSENSLFPHLSREQCQQISSKSDGDIAKKQGGENNGGDSEDKGEAMTSMKTAVGPNTQVTAEGLILPKRLHNPCAESQDRRQLHRELMLNQKIGKNVLNQKSELQKALEKHKENQFKKEVEASKQENMSPLEKVIEQRAKRLEILERDLNDTNSHKEPEFLQIHAKLRARMDAK